MNALIVAGAWLGGASLAEVLVRATRVRRFVALGPPAAVAAALLTQPAAGHPSVVLAPGGLGLDRTALGLVAAGAASLTLALSLAPRVDGREALTYGLVGALVTISLGTGSPVVWAVVLVAAIGVIALRWIGAAPSRATLASARVPGVGSVALLAAGPFLPLVGVVSGPRPAIAAGLLGGGVASLVALMPLGGWARAALTTLRGTEVAPWAFLIAPVVLITAERIPGATPAAGEDFGRILLVIGLVSALFSAVSAVRPEPRERYARVLLADLGLSSAAIGSLHPSLASSGALLLVLTHLALGPLLLQGPRSTYPLARRAAWVALSGLPPAPAFWARFFLLEALVQAGPAEAVASLLTAGLLAIASIAAATRADPAAPATAGPPALAGGVASWLGVLAAAAVGLAPASAAAAVFGGLGS